MTTYLSKDQGNFGFSVYDPFKYTNSQHSYNLWTMSDYWHPPTQDVNRNHTEILHTIIPKRLEGKEMQLFSLDVSLIVKFQRVSKSPKGF